MPLRSQSVTVAVEEHGQVVVLVVAGEVDLLTVPQFQEALTLALENRPETLVVDLSKVEFMGSAGLAALVGAYQSAGEHTRLRVVAASTAILRPLQLTGLDKEINVYPSREDAFAAE